MITLIEALNFRCLKYIRQPLGPLHVLVGPNGSGKTAFLDVIAFLSRLVSGGLEAAVYERTHNLRDLVWGRSEGHFELALEASIPADRRAKLANKDSDTIRYEISLGIDPGAKRAAILAERALLKAPRPLPETSPQRDLFPLPAEPPNSIMAPRVAKGAKTVVNKIEDGHDNFYDETGKGWDHAFQLGPRKSALANVPEDESRFPVSTWLKRFLAEGVQQVVLNCMSMRKASPPVQIRGFKPDGSNLPWVVAALEKDAPARFQDWIACLRTALPDLETIRTVEREDDLHRYLVLCYRGGLEAPSWVAPDGALRLLALTLPAYLPGFEGIYLIEEPENGIHPLAVEAMFRALSSVSNAQILMATHSPVLLRLAQPEQLLCFARTPEGASDIVLGSEHPALKDRPRPTNLAELFSSGALG